MEKEPKADLEYKSEEENNAEVGDRRYEAPCLRKMPPLPVVLNPSKLDDGHG